MELIKRFKLKTFILLTKIYITIYKLNEAKKEVLTR